MAALKTPGVGVFSSGPPAECEITGIPETIRNPPAANGKERILIHRIVALAAGLLLVSTAAFAGPNWQTIGLSISLADLPKVQAALEKLMSTAGADLEGNVSLMANVAGGDTSHSIISSFDSRAEREAWLGKLYASDAWAEYAKATAGLTAAGETSRMDFVKSWGEENADSDVFWEIHAFTVTDAAAFLAVLDSLQASDAGKASPAQVHLSAVAAAGLSPVTHLISVGFASEAQAETANAATQATEDWATYLEASGKAGSYEGTFLLRTIATWGGSGE